MKNTNIIICLENKTIYASGKDAAKANEVTASDVSMSARKIKAVKGLNFRFIDDNGNPVETPAKPKYKWDKNKANDAQLEMETPIVVIHEESIVTAEQGSHINGNSKAVCCLEEGKVYPSLTDAAKALGVTGQTISNRCYADNDNFFFVKDASDNIESMMAYIRSLQSKVNDPEYLAWKKAKEDAEAEERRKKAEQEAFERRKAELEAKVVKQSEAVKAVSIKLAHEREVLEAIITELDQHMTKAN